MKFEKLSEYKNKRENITILYPGGFKPLTGAHINLIDRYLEKPNVKKIVLFLSPNKREEINSEDAFKIIKYVLKNRNIEVVLDKDSYSPILAIYRWIQKPEREPGKYALASSTKGNDYKRVKEFTKNYSPEKYEKNLPKGVKVIEFPIDTKPLIYPNREPISATRVRKDLRNNDYESFKENYPGLREDLIQYIWNILKNKDKNIEENSRL